MWEQYFLLDGFTARTSHRATTAKFNQSLRGDMTDEARAAEIRAFAVRMDEEDFIARWDAKVAERTGR